MEYGNIKKRTIAIKTCDSICVDEITTICEPEFVEIEDAKTTIHKKVPAKKICCICLNSLCQLLPFPNKITERSRYLKWCAKLKMDPPTSDFVCVLHFTPKDVYQQNGKILLKLTAIPSKKFLLPSESGNPDPLDDQNEFVTQPLKPVHNSISLIKAENLKKAFVPILKKITRAEFLQNIRKTGAKEMEDNPSEPPRKVQKIVEKPQFKEENNRCKISSKNKLDKGNQTDTRGYSLTLDSLRPKKLVDLIKTPQQLKSWTGIRSFDTLEKLVYEFTRMEMQRPPLFAMERTDRILAVLIRMHLNLPLQCLGTLFNTNTDYLKKMLIPNYLNLMETIEKYSIEIEGKPTVQEFNQMFEEEILAEDSNEAGVS